MTTQVSTILAIAVSTVGLGVTMWRLLAPVLRISRYLHGEDGDDRRGIPSRPGILERQTATERSLLEQKAELATYRELQEHRDAEVRRLLLEVVAQLRNNGGSSVKDLVEKTLAAVTSPAVQEAR